jgi:Outer membrane protein beta-barrel domain
MKRLFTLCIAICTTLAGFAQTDTTGKQNPEPKNDTIRIGGMIIIRKAGNKDTAIAGNKEYKMRNRKGDKPSNLSTNWWIFDIGFSSYTDNTIYNSAAAQAYATGSNNTWFDLKDGKSRNVNVWFFMQKLNVSKHVLNLKYGVGLELNNYHYKQPIRYTAIPLAIVDPPRVSLDGTSGRTYKKNKLAADYLTVPIMANLNFTPKRKKGFGLSAGISAGYLYSARNKTNTSDEGKKKAKDDFELDKWKLSYVAELSLGPVRFYGSMAFKNMYERGLDIKPYTFGFRFSNW